jgi:hypothetical protein
MKKLDLSKYALMLENNAFVVEATPSAATKAAAKSLATPVDTDTAGLKAIKAIINDPTGKKQQYDSIIGQLEPFILSQDVNLKTTPLKFKEGEIDYEVIVNRAVDPKGNYMVWFDEDGTKILIDGLDMNFLATQFRRGVEGTSVFGLNFGTDEDKLAAIAGAIHSTAAGANANPTVIFDALNKAYTAAYQEDMYAALDGEFTGSPDAFARALYGQEITEKDIQTALGVDFLQSLALDVVIGVATFGVGAAAKGLFTGARAIRAAGAVNKISGTAKAFRSGLAGNATGVGIRGGANVATLAAGAADANLAKSGFSAITAAGNAARTGAAIGAGVGAGVAAGQGISAATSDVNTQGGQAIDAEAAAYAYCTQIREVAKGYTDGADELQIAFMILALNAQSAQLVTSTWSKNFGDEGEFYEYCVASELSGDLLSLVNGYWAGITGTGPLADEASKIKTNMKKGAAPAQPEKKEE